MDSDDTGSEVREILHHLGVVVGALLLSHGFDLLIQWQGIEGVPLWSMKFSQLILILIAVGAFLESLEHVGEIYKAAWQIRKFRVALSIVLIISALFVGVWAYGVATDPPEIHDDKIEGLQEDRQESLEKATEAEDPEEVEEHMRAAEEASTDIQMYRFHQDVLKILYWIGGALATGLPLLLGISGLIQTDAEVSASGA